MRALAAGAGLVAYALFAALLLWLYSPEGDDLPIALAPCADSAGAAPGSIPFYELLDAPGAVSLCAELPAGPELLVLPRLSGNAFTASVDGETRLRVGAPDRPANFWLQPQLVPLDDLPPRDHSFRLDLSGQYDLGVRVTPFLTSWRTGGRRMALLSWLTGDLIPLVTGLNLGVGLLLAAYGFQRRRERGEYLLLALTSITAALYMLDYQPAGGAPTVALFLVRRKISLAGAYLTVAGLVAALERSARVRRRLGPAFFVGAAVLCAIVFAQPDLVALRDTSSWAATLTIPFALFAVVVAVRRFEPVFALLWAFFAASALHTLANVAFAHGHLFLLHYGMLAGTLAAGVRTSMQLTRVSRDLERASRAALTDPLTGARNRAFCDNLSLAATDVVAVVDFDDFKRVNDRHGHGRGDRLLVDFVLAARSRLRPTDHVVRMGGDEFALILRQVDHLSARRICAEIVESWRDASADLRPSASFGVAEVGARSFEDALAVADARMYEIKARRRAAAPPPAV